MDEIFINKFNDIQRKKYAYIIEKIQENNGNITLFKIPKTMPISLFEEFAADINPYVHDKIKSKLRRRIRDRRRRKKTYISLKLDSDYDIYIKKYIEEINQLITDIEFLKTRKKFEEEINKMLLSQKKTLTNFIELNDIIKLVETGYFDFTDGLILS